MTDELALEIAVEAARAAGEIAYYRAGFTVTASGDGGCGTGTTGGPAAVGDVLAGILGRGAVAPGVRRRWS